MIYLYLLLLVLVVDFQVIVAEDCPKGWTLYKRKSNVWICKKFYNFDATTDISPEESCYQQNAYLLSFEDVEEKDDIERRMLARLKELGKPSGAFYTSAFKRKACPLILDPKDPRCATHENMMMWQDSFTNQNFLKKEWWLPGEPNGILHKTGGDVEDCIQMIFYVKKSYAALNGKLNDHVCSAFAGSYVVNSDPHIWRLYGCMIRIK